MLKIVKIGLAIALQFWLPARGMRPPEPSAGINGTFFSTRKPYRLASLVYWDGKRYGAFPSSETSCRGGLVCYKDGTVEAGYFTVVKGELKWNGKNPEWDKIKWAITGGGLFLYNGKVYSACEVSKKESLSLYITRHRRYSFIAVHKDRKTVTIGVSLGYCSPTELARAHKNKYYAILRLDGGSQTAYWLRKPPKSLHNGVGFTLKN